MEESWGVFMSGLLTDFYELTMLQGYFLAGQNPRVVFDMFYRREPFGGGYALFAGLADALARATTLSFSKEDIDYLDSLGAFRREFLDLLAGLRFTGDLWAIEEGAVVFAGEPLVRVHAPLIEAQILESALLNILNFQTLIATKAARVVVAARGGAVIEFGMRRAQGPDGALSASRAAFIGGAIATSNTLAGRRFGIPVRGTMAHSWIMAFPDELAAFRAYARAYPDNCILLIDTYDTLASGLPNAITVGRELASSGHQGFGVRIDSGDLEFLARRVRAGLDAAGMRESRIIASNELDEHIIEQLANRGAPIDAWGVGTRLVTGEGDPALSGVYKIVAREATVGGPGAAAVRTAVPPSPVPAPPHAQPRDGAVEPAYMPLIKVSNHPEKVTNPGVKQVWRFLSKAGSPLADLIALSEEEVPRGRPYTFHYPIIRHPTGDWRSFTLAEYAEVRPMLSLKIKGGRLVAPSPPVSQVRERAQRELALLDDAYKRLVNPHRYKVSLSERLAALKARLIAEALGTGASRGASEGASG